MHGALRGNGRAQSGWRCPGQGQAGFYQQPLRAQSGDGDRCAPPERSLGRGPVQEFTAPLTASHRETLLSPSSNRP